MLDEKITIPIDQLANCVLPMFAITPSAEWHGVGTGFVIGRLDERSAVVVTAAHNLQGLERLLHRRPRSHASTLSEFGAPPSPTWRELGVDLVFLVRGKTGAAVATVVRDALLLEHDLAVVQVTLPANGETTFEMALPVDLNPQLTAATHVAAIGYAGLSATSTQDFDRKEFRATAVFPLTSRDGRVLRLVAPAEGIHRGRFGAMVDIPFDGGMSGGPVIELRGSTPVVRALVSADVSENSAIGAEGSGAYAFASLLLPIAGLRLHGTTTSFLDQTEIKDPSVLELIGKGVVKHSGDVEPVRVVDADGKVTVTWSAAFPIDL
jgi:hypothetical protein|nr:trypsin-like peptidase domain-containing protein [Kofleriaceae bacterium]